MEKLFKAAHKLTKEMVEKYNVDYQAQFSINLSYLQEEEEIMLLNQEIQKELTSLGLAEAIEKANAYLVKKTVFTKELVEDLYSNNRRELKSNNLWDSKTTGIALEERYTGEKIITISSQKLWVKEDKVRLYVNLNVDGVVSKGWYLKIK